MDRFIELFDFISKSTYSDLKSNMDRFIGEKGYKDNTVIKI